MLGIGASGTIVKGRIVVAFACHDDLEALRFERLSDFSGEDEDDFAFANAFGATGAQVDSTMGGIKNDSGELAVRKELRLRWSRGGRLGRRRSWGGSWCGGLRRDLLGGSG